MSPPPPDDVQRARETRAWALRSRGWSQSRIASELEMTQSGVSRLLNRVEKRELRRLSGRVERLKVTQNAQLEHVIEESFDAWHRSKEPKKRAAERRTVGDGQGDGDAVQTTQVEERDGDTGYLYAGLQALSHQRSLWGMDVMPELSEGAASVAELARDLFNRGAGYEERQAQAGRGPVGPDGTDPGGAGEVPG